MAAKNPKVDAYIQNAAPFAHPILHHLRTLIHDVCPTVEENIKWGMPSFEYKGLWCGFSAFKNHCSFGFWKAAIMKNATEFLKEENRGSMGSIGKLTSVKDLPSDRQLRSWLKESMLLNDQDIKVPKEKTKHPRKEIETPDWFIAAVKKNKKAWATFDKATPGFKKEYVQWVTEAKTEDTRTKRLAQSIEWMAEGKHRNWKYMK